MQKLILQRLSYGFTQLDFEEFQQKGFANWLQSQLNPNDSEDTILAEKLKQATLPIEFDREVKNKMKRIKENRPLNAISASLSDLWKLSKNTSFEEKQFVALEVVAAIWLRAVYSKFQLRELLVEFWHNHFNVSIHADERIALALPIYDRDVIRKNCFGNFRTFIEDVAKSTAMLLYLDNYLSKASPANENYARELFELHTLGATHYYNHLYNRWRQVPGALEGKPEGYIDEDVYEAARAFTGWTIANGADDEKGGKFSDTGEFYYYEGWHDNYQKRVLATEIDPNQPPLADGLRVLDLVAYHPATAKFLCTKLCKRLVADEPPQSLIDKAVVVWTQYQKSEEQIEKVVETIVLSDEFTQSLGKKIKRPFELMASFFRAVEPVFTPNQLLYWITAQTGYLHFSWATPTGHPDHAAHWINSGMMLTRWNVILALTLNEDWHKITHVDLLSQLPPAIKTFEEIVTYWIKRLVVNPISSEDKQRVMSFFAQGASEDDMLEGNAQDKEDKLRNLVSLLCTMPHFQYR